MASRAGNSISRATMVLRRRSKIKQSGNTSATGLSPLRGGRTSDDKNSRRPWTPGSELLSHHLQLLWWPLGPVSPGGQSCPFRSCLRNRQRLSKSLDLRRQPAQTLPFQNRPCFQPVVLHGLRCIEYAPAACARGGGRRRLGHSGCSIPLNP